MDGHIRPAITWQWAEGAVPMMAGRMADTVVDVLKETGVEKEQIGIDNLDMQAIEAFQKLGLNIVNGWPAMSKARTRQDAGRDRAAEDQLVASATPRCGRSRTSG